MRPGIRHTVQGTDRSTQVPPGPQVPCAYRRRQVVDAEAAQLNAAELDRQLSGEPAPHGRTGY